MAQYSFTVAVFSKNAAFFFSLSKCQSNQTEVTISSSSRDSQSLEAAVIYFKDLDNILEDTYQDRYN